MIKECFMNLECRFKWEKEIAEGDGYVLVCLEIVCIHINVYRCVVFRAGAGPQTAPPSGGHLLPYSFPFSPPDPQFFALN